MSSILKQQLANVAYAKEKLFAQGISGDDQEAAFQEDMFFPTSKAELDSAKYAVEMQMKNKQFDDARAKQLNAILTTAFQLYLVAPVEMRKDRVAKAKAEAAAEKALAEKAEGKKGVVKTENVKTGWLSKGNNKWWLIGGLALLATTITIIVVKKKQK